MREARIRGAGNVVPEFTKEYVSKIMDMHGVDEYRIELWGDIRIVSKYDTWLIETDGEVIYLKHGNIRQIRVGNDRNSYHIHNVFYDLEYCVKSIVEHDKFKEGIID